MSPRLIAILMLTVTATAMATETTTETAVEETGAAVEQATEEAIQEAEAVVEETGTATEEMTEEVAQQAEAAVEETETMVEETGTAAEEMTEGVAQQAEAAVEETETMVEETGTAAEEMTEEVAQQAEAAVEETETMVEETGAAAEEMTEEAAQDAEAATEDMTEQAASQDAAAAQQQADTSDIQAKLAACAACHGADGNSAIPQNPKLAGQVPGYIADQLSKFKSGERENAIMAAQVANLTEQDMVEIDAHYAAQQPQLGAISEEMKEQALIGEKIYRGGEPSMSISACMSCHGPSGKGIPVRFPRVSGQHIEYLQKSLLDYKSGSRQSDIMNSIAFRLSEQQIEALAIYMHGLK